MPKSLIIDPAKSRKSCQWTLRRPGEPSTIPVKDQLAAGNFQQSRSDSNLPARLEVIRASKHAQ